MASVRPAELGFPEEGKQMRLTSRLQYLTKFTLTRVPAALVLVALFMATAPLGVCDLQFYSWSSGQVGADGAQGNFVNNFGTGFVAQTTLSTGPLNVSSDGIINGGISNGSASLTGLVTPGQLHGVVIGTAQQDAVAGVASGGVAQLTEFWDDTITVLGGLSTGTPVDVLVTFRFHAVVS